MTSCSSAASGARGRRRRIGAALALACGLAAAAAAADGGEALEPVPEPAPARERVLESRWRRPPGCEPAPTFQVLEDGTRVREARAELPRCGVTGDADAQVRAWLDAIWIGVDAERRRRPRR